MLQTGTSGNGVKNTNASTDHARMRMASGSMIIDREESRFAEDSTENFYFVQ